MTKPADTAAFAGATGRSWEQWLTFLTEIGASELSHKDIALRIVETGDSSEWWAQGITVAFEQHIGRRQPGQRQDGTFEVSANKSVPEGLDEAMLRWEQAVADHTGFDGVAMAKQPERSETPKWRYWRVDLGDGTRVQVTIGSNAGAGSNIAIQHGKLVDAQDKDRWRSYWKGVLSTI